MGPNTPEEREDLILKTIERSNGIGFNQLQKQTGIPKKTLSKYLKKLGKDVILKTPKGKKKSHGVIYSINFSEDTKKAIRFNLAQITQDNISFFDTKYRKSNIFPHLLQGLAAEYYQNLISYFFDSIPAYKYGVKRIEEFLEMEKEKFEKEFTKKEKVRISDACQEVQSVLSSNAWNSIITAQERNMIRTRDEVITDCNEISNIRIPDPKNINTKPVKTKWGLDNFRVHFIEDNQTKELFIKLANEYNELAKKMRNIRIRLAWMTHGPPWEPKSKDFKFGNFFEID